MQRLCGEWTPSPTPFFEQALEILSCAGYLRHLPKKGRVSSLQYPPQPPHVTTSPVRKGRHQNRFPMGAFSVLTSKGNARSMVVFLSARRHKATTVCELLNEVRSTERNPLLPRKHGRVQALLQYSWCHPPRTGKAGILPPW